MKKVLLLTLTLSLLASCASNGETNITSNDTTDSSVSTPATEDKDTVDEQEDTEQPEGENPLNLLYAQAITDARDEDANNFNPIIVDKEDEFSDFIFPLLDFDTDNAQGFAISVSTMNAQAYGIIAILPVEGAKEVVLAGMQQFMDTQIQNFSGYLPDQLEIAQSARLETLEDGTLLLVMCPEQDDVFDSIVANLG